MEAIELYGMEFSTFVWTTRIAFVEKGAPYVLKPARPRHGEPAEIHPLGRIPVMRHGAFVLFESKAICAYIDRLFDGPPLIPPDAMAAALAEQWISFIISTTDTACVRHYLLPYFFPAAPGAPDRARIEANVPAMRRQLDIFENRLERSAYLAGDSFTLADAYLAPILHYLQKTPESAEIIARSHGLRAFTERMSERPSVRATQPPPMSPG